MLMRGLSDSEFIPRLFAFDKNGPLYDEATSAGIAITDGGYDTFASRPLKILMLIRTFFRLWRLLRESRADVVHGFLPLANLFSAVAGKLAGTRLVITSRRALNTHQERILGWRYADKLSTRLSDVVVSNSKAVMEDTLHREGGDAARFRVIYNGLDVQRFSNATAWRKQMRADLHLEEKQVVLIIVANLIPYKGHVELVDAVAQLLRNYHEVRLLVVGEDRGISGELKKRADVLGVSSVVQWLGLRHDIPELLAAADIYVSASHEEGFSNALLEAMAASKAVVATRVGGNVEMLEEGALGLLVAPQNPSALADAIGSLLQHPEIRADFGARAARHVAESYSPGRMRDQYLEIYRSGVGGDDQL